MSQQNQYASSATLILLRPITSFLLSKSKNKNESKYLNRNAENPFPNKRT